ncbi:unnamed protein product, partial [Prorocentrum cordatum]
KKFAELDASTFALKLLSECFDHDRMLLECVDCILDQLAKSRARRASADVVGMAMGRTRTAMATHGAVTAGSLLQRDAFLIRNGGSDIVYAWMAEQDYELLQDKSHQELVTGWIASLNRRLE